MTRSKPAHPANRRKPASPEWFRAFYGAAGGIAGGGTAEDVRLSRGFVNGNRHTEGPLGVQNTGSRV